MPQVWKEKTCTTHFPLHDQNLQKELVLVPSLDREAERDLCFPTPLLQLNTEMFECPLDQ